jgi:TRAP-type C4-dicarboxylate transport system substrate-binding protein
VIRRPPYASPRLAAVLVAALSAALAAPAAAAATTVKLATLVPEGSVWDKELRAMGADWEKRTAGRVKLQLYPGGVAGDEAAVVRRIRIGQLQAATLTAATLADLDPAFNVLGIPGFYDSYEELFAVVDALTPLLAERLDRHGYVLLNWGSVGWLHLFSRQPVHTPAELRELKLWTAVGDEQMAQWWKKNGFHPVPLVSTDIMTGLQTGMIETLPTTPLVALAYQWYRSTPYMLDRGFAPLVGATVISKRSWNALSEEDRKALAASAAALEERLRRAIPEQDARAVREMEKRGLTLTRPRNAEEVAAWEREATAFATSMRELLVPADVFARAQEARARHRGSRTGR